MSVLEQAAAVVAAELDRATQEAVADLLRCADDADALATRAAAEDCLALACQATALAGACRALARGITDDLSDDTEGRP